MSILTSENLKMKVVFPGNLVDFYIMILCNTFNQNNHTEALSVLKVIVVLMEIELVCDDWM